MRDDNIIDCTIVRRESSPFSFDPFKVTVVLLSTLLWGGMLNDCTTATSKNNMQTFMIVSVLLDDRKANEDFDFSKVQKMRFESTSQCAYIKVWALFMNTGRDTSEGSKVMFVNHDDVRTRRLNTYAWLISSGVCLAWPRWEMQYHFKFWNHRSPRCHRFVRRCFFQRSIVCWWMPPITGLWRTFFFIFSMF
jgi:hypothetical protein